MTYGYEYIILYKFAVHCTGGRTEVPAVVTNIPRFPGPGSFNH